jgi:hypothetical protein
MRDKNRIAPGPSISAKALGWRDLPRGFETEPGYLPLQDDIASPVY